MNNSMEGLWSGLGVGLFVFLSLAGFALLVWVLKEKEDEDA